MEIINTWSEMSYNKYSPKGMSERLYFEREEIAYPKQESDYEINEKQFMEYFGKEEDV